ncbi:helix-turn-helix domain-containing protein [Rossellomorea sp. YZS02]|uniref:helix-turn-helix domain-containing protein n=1 Tax=Rossellomorea sp. YZS02 TaxID=3097358 RepID=UPI002A10F93A|nr:helix-turn-helix domain-containing protein [Rossellomorea sp. YZS02]MDX8344102.1 helix-turn-helix domain-containing protein [Rossellomorea sp. YZS02]
MVGDKIKSLREEKGYTINELAHYSNVSKSYISSIERGIQKNPSIKILKKIALTLDTSLENILSSDKNKIQLDEEWIEPLNRAISQGLTKEEFIEFLSFVQFKRRNLHD